MRSWSVSLVLCVALFACKNADTGGPTGTMVVARVNGDEISLRQVSRIVDYADGGTSRRQAQQAADDALERLIDQTLLMQKALEAGLDRDQRVVEAIEFAKRRILAEAYLERKVLAGDGERQGAEPQTAAAAQIELARSEIRRLRDAARIEYLDRPEALFMLPPLRDTGEVPRGGYQEIRRKGSLWLL